MFSVREHTSSAVRRRGCEPFLLAALLIPLSCFLSPSLAQDDAKEPATPSSAEKKVLPDPEADARLKEALKDTSPELAQMIPLSGGTYTMGSPLDFGSTPAGWLVAIMFGGRALVDQGPAHEVTIDGFYLGKYEVTVEQFLCFLNVTDSKDQRYLFFHQKSPVFYKGKRWRCEEGREHEAADTITWYGAKAFCDWLSETTGDTYRLPTEAEWEWAAKGKEGRLYPWGLTLKDFPTNEDERRKFTADIRKRADWWGPRRPVGSFPNGATPDGICDMVGGVWEWCDDWYSTRHDTDQKLNPKAYPPLLFGGRVMRGGRENVPGVITQTTTRLEEAPGGRDGHMYGMRLLRAAKVADKAD